MVPAWALPRRRGAMPPPSTAPCLSRGTRRRCHGSGRRSLAGAGILCLAAVLLPLAMPGSPSFGTAAMPSLLTREEEKAPPSTQLGGGDEPRVTMVSQVVDWARKAGGGPASVALLFLAEVVAILLCIPGYSTLDYAAGALFGFFWGTVIVASAKSVTALIAFALIRTLRDSAWGRWAEQRVLGSARGGLGTRIQKGIEESSFKFSLLVRCSPLPAWLSNYALPLAGVPFPTYLAASLIGMLPPVITNVYAGSVATAVVVTLSGGTASGPGGVIGLLAVGVSVLSSTLLVHQLSTASMDEGAEPEA